MLIRKRRRVRLSKTKNQRPIEIVLPTKSQSTDRTKQLQPLNGVLDVLLKAAPLSVIPGALVLHRYLDGLGAKSLFPQLLSSPGGLFAILFGLGMVLFAVAFSLAVSPWILRFTRNDLGNTETDELFAFWPIFCLTAAVQIATFIMAICNAAPVGLLLSPLFPVGVSAVFIRKKVKCRHLIRYILFTFVAQVFVVLPWFYLVGIAENLTVDDAHGVDKNVVEIVLIAAWSVVYAAVTAAYVSYKQADVKEGFLAYATGLTVVCGSLLVFMFLLSPKYFVNTAMSFISVRQVPKQSTWWHVDSSAFARVSPGYVNTSLVKRDQDSTYFCSYSPLIYPEKTILCPKNIDKPDLKSCFVFSGGEARLSVVPVGKEWACGQ